MIYLLVMEVDLSNLEYNYKIKEQTNKDIIAVVKRMLWAIIEISKRLVSLGKC